MTPVWLTLLVASGMAAGQSDSSPAVVDRVAGAKGQKGEPASGGVPPGPPGRRGEKGLDGDYFADGPRRGEDGADSTVGLEPLVRVILEQEWLRNSDLEVVPDWVWAEFGPPPGEDDDYYYYEEGKNSNNGLRVY